MGPGKDAGPWWGVSCAAGKGEPASRDVCRSSARPS